MVVSVILLSAAALAGCRTGVDRPIRLDEAMETGTWRILADVPVGRFGGAAAVVDGRLHLFGGVNMNPHTPEGHDRAEAVDLHHVYDPASDRWWEAAPMPNGRCCGAAGVIGDKLYVAGGFWQWVDDVCECKETWGFPFPPP